MMENDKFCKRGDELSEMLQFYIFANELTIATFAKCVGCSRQSVNDWSRRKSFPSSANIKRISDVMGISVSYALGVSEEPLPPKTEAPSQDEFRYRLENLMRKNKTRGTYLSRELGVSYHTIYRWKTGASLPKPEMLVALSEVLNCSVDYLLGTTDII